MAADLSGVRAIQNFDRVENIYVTEEKHLVKKKQRR